MCWNWIFWQNKDVCPACCRNIEVTLNSVLSTLGLESVFRLQGSYSEVKSKVGTGVKHQNKRINPEGEEEGKALGDPVLELHFLVKSGWVSCFSWEY